MDGNGTRWPRTRLATFVGAAVLIATLLACEHAKFWRGGHGWDPDFLITISDPDKAHAELVRRMADPAPRAQSLEAAAANSAGCISCHGETDDADMHPGRTLAIGCIDCHGGDAAVTLADGIERDSAPFYALMHKAHVAPRNPAAWYTDDLLDGRGFGEHKSHGSTGSLHSRRRSNAYALLNQEAPEFVRFINPGDLRVADFACGACHAEQVVAVRHSMMNHGAMLWGAALYNNGSIPNKLPVYGESYSAFGQPQELHGVVDTGSAKWNRDTSRIDVDARWPSREEMDAQGVLPLLRPLPVWNITQPGNVLRIFERGTQLPVPGGPTPNAPPSEIALPNPVAEPGRPDKGLSVRGLGTLNRTDPVFLGLQKTRLLDPLLSFPGTNDHPGDFRASGCTACHTPYANDRDPYHSGPYAPHGNLGRSASIDPTVPKERSGHPIKHVLTNAIPNSQCITCHIHPGTSYANSYLGYMWWDNESDGEAMYPRTSHRPTPDQEWRANRKNPDAAQLRGLWGNLYPEAVSHTGVVAGRDFLERTGEPRANAPSPFKAADAAGVTEPGAEKAVFNDTLQHNQFADFHGHGWMFRAVFKKDRHGNMIDREGNRIDPEAPDKWTKAVHLKDIHLERGMQCIDCHFDQDAHGNGKLYGEARNATEITCIDCHGSYDKYATLRTTGPAAPPGGSDLSKMWVGLGRERKRRFEWRDGKLVQRSSLDPNIEWAVTQTLDTINPASAWSQKNPDSAKLSRYAKTMRKDGKTWGDLPKADEVNATQASAMLAHSPDEMECYTCHTSWMTSCFGCHLPMKANERTPMLHNESLYTRNYTQYNFQVLRDDVFMLGRDGSVKGGRIVPVRSSSAVLVSSQNQNREWVYHQQQTISGEGFSGQAFNPHFPHATGGVGTTKNCTDCHLAEDNSNNAWMAQLLLQGTNFVNFMGRYAYVATGKGGLEAVAVTEHDEPQAVYGSHLHFLAYPDEFKAMKRVERSPEAQGESPVLLGESYHHDAGAPGRSAEILDLQLRGEYLYAARGSGGFHVFDVANIDNKGFSERIVTAPVSPLGQRLGFDTKNAVAIASPTTLGVDPVRERLSSDPTKPRAVGMDQPQPWHINREQPIHPIYAYLYIGDAEEGLILTNAATLLDGDPTNNFLVRATLDDGNNAFNPSGSFTGLTSLTLAGHHAYITAPSGMAIIDLDKPTAPRVIASVGNDVLREPRGVALQFRYAFVTDTEGLKVIDVTKPESPRLISGATVPLADARRLYVARTWAFVANGKEGLAIINVTNPEKPVLTQMFNDAGRLNDCRDIKVAMTNASLFAYVADGVNGLKVLELMGPNTTPQFRGFITPLAPRVIAVRKTHGPALAISKPLDRDRAVDETGGQIAVFGRWGARPLNLTEMQRMYLRDGRVWTVTDQPTTSPVPFSTAAPTETAKESIAPVTPAPGSRPRRPGAR